MAQRPRKCFNCDDNHMATSKDCPIFLKESEVERELKPKSLSHIQRHINLWRLPHLHQWVKPILPWVKPSVRTVDAGCQTISTWLHWDRSVGIDLDNVPITGPSRTASTEGQTPSAPAQAGMCQKPKHYRKAQPKTSTVGPENKKRGSDDPIVLASRYQHLQGPLLEGEDILPKRNQGDHCLAILPPKWKGKIIIQ